MLPKPVDWLQALCLFVIFNLWASLQYWLWGKNVALIALFLLSPLSHPWLAVNILVVPIMFLCYTHWFLWGKEGTGFPAWLPSPDSWIFATLQWTTTLFSAAVATYPLIFLISVLREFISEPQEGLVITLSVLWTSTFLYLLALTTKGRRLLKGKPKPPKPPL